MLHFGRGDEPGARLLVAANQLAREVRHPSVANRAAEDRYAKLVRRLAAECGYSAAKEFKICARPNGGRGAAQHSADAVLRLARRGGSARARLLVIEFEAVVGDEQSAAQAYENAACLKLYGPAKGQRDRFRLSAQAIRDAEIYPILVAIDPRPTVTAHALRVPRMTYQEFIARLLAGQAFTQLKPVSAPKDL